MVSYVPEYLKSKNRKMVFDLFVKHEVLSRAEIVQKTKMSFPTVSKAVDFLLSRNIIREGAEEQESTGPGRKRHSLYFNPKAYCALTLNFEGGYVEIGMVDLSGNLLVCEEQRFDSFSNARMLENLTERFLAIVKMAPSPVLGVGVGLPADVNPNTGEIISMNDSTIQTPVLFSELFEPAGQHFKNAVFVENDVNMACKGEMFRRGNKIDNRDLCYLTLGTGFGAGLIMDGKLWRGGGFRAGEIGHMRLHLLDPEQPFENQGTSLEDKININALDQKFGLNLLENSNLTEDMRKEIVQYLLPYLLTAIYNVAHLFDIGQYVLSGFIPDMLGEPLFKELQEKLDELLANYNRKVYLNPPVAPHASLAGLGSMVFEKTILDELKN